MANENFNHGVMRLCLSRLYGAGITEMVDDYGRIHRGIFIPFEMNNIRITEGGEAVVTIFVNKRFHNPKKNCWDYFLKLYLDEQTIEQYRKLGLCPPRIGYYSETATQMMDSRDNFRVSMSIEQKL